MNNRSIGNHCAKAIMVAFLSFAVAGCGENERVIAVAGVDQVFEKHMVQVIYSDKVQEKDNAQRVKTLSLSAVGDMMVHRTQLLKADRGEAYDFSPSFRYVRDVFENDDYTFANLETTFAGAYNQRKINVEEFHEGYSGYPCFNTPDQFAYDLYDAGVDFLSTANNHSYDSKKEGIYRTLEVLDQVGLNHTGTFESEDKSKELEVIELEGITFGVINYTYGLNGLSLKDDELFVVNTLNMYDEQRIDEMYRKVADASDKVDFVVVMLHYGNEYVLYPDKYYQKPIVEDLFEKGADIILGGHPHVLQPIEVKDLVREDGSTEQGVVVYSLGNFLSSQKSRFNELSPTDIGGIFHIEITQFDDKKPKISGIGFTPTMTYWAKDGIYIVPTLSIDEALNYSYEDKQTIQRANNEVMPHMMSYYNGEWYKEGNTFKVKINN